MKVNVIIIQDGNERIKIEDETLISIDEYTKKLSTILKSDSVVIVEFKSEVLILRPSKITSIIVKKLLDDEEDCIVES